ncbi:MAG: exodeoxyribonuclease VII small subunit [Eggerthellales bacterium]|nr:exodeoxyribonuclease VII small subunit [Eggerthellales bacterium]
MSENSNKVSQVPVEELSFREAMNELQGIVSGLESNTLEVEESLLFFERGVSLLRSLRGRMSDAQQKVDVLIGELEAADDDGVVDTTLHKA